MAEPPLWQALLSLFLVLTSKHRPEVEVRHQVYFPDVSHPNHQLGTQAWIESYQLLIRLVP